MTIEPLLILELALLGIATGFLAGLLGIGGGMLMVPFSPSSWPTRAIPADYAVKMAVATSLATICFTSLSSRARAPPARRRAVADRAACSRRASWWASLVGAQLGRGASRSRS